MVLDFTDEALTECINSVISGLLPHENYEPQNFSVLYPTLKSVVSTEDTRGIYYIMYTILDKYQSIAATYNQMDFKVNITRERFSDGLQNNLPDLILEPNTDVATLMAQEGRSSDITIPTVQQEIMGVLYEKTMALYETCFHECKAYEDSMSKIVDLKDCVRSNIIETGMLLQRSIMSVGTRAGKKSYRGPVGWLSFTKDLIREVSELDAPEQDDLVCEGIDMLDAIEVGNQRLSEPLGNYGIPQLDDFTPMLRHRLAVIVAKENVGKTKMITHLIASLIRVGIKPFFACGETPKDLMFNNIVSSYIFQEYGMFYEVQYLSGEGYTNLSSEDKQIVNSAKARVASSGLVISNNLEYDNVMSKITSYYHLGCEAFFIDHTQSLRGRNSRKIGDLVTTLSQDCRDLKNMYPIYICMASHPSTNLKDLLQKENIKDMQISPTAQSAGPSQEADEIFILNETEYLAKQNLLQLITYKRRSAPKIKPIYLKKMFNVSSFIYDPRLQGANDMDNDEIEGLLDSIRGSDEDEEDDALVLDY